jgi:hypothetical protein
MTERTKAWQCIGCGRMESQATCIGICQDRPVEIISAVDYDALAAETADLRGEVEALRLFVRQLATVSPRGGDWEAVYRSLQAAANRVLAKKAPATSGDVS